MSAFDPKRSSVVVDLIAIANGEAGLGAVPPDRALHEPRKRRRERWIELAGVDVGCKEMENFSAPSRPVASIPVRMVSAQPVEDPGSVQEIVDEGVDSHEGRADFDPQRPSAACCQQQVRQRHRQHLVGNAIDVPERADDRFAQGSEPVRGLGIHSTQLPINPADEIIIGDIPHEQKQAVRHLVEAAVPERVPRQRAAVDVAGLSTRAGPFVVPAVGRTANTRSASGMMGFVTAPRRHPPSGRCRVGRYILQRLHPRSLESSTCRPASRTGQGCHGL